MALYAFDGTWNSDEDEPDKDTNVVRFTELYSGNSTEYISGVGTRYGKVGEIFGGLFGSGGRHRIDEMYEELCDNWEQGDKVIDIIGFSRGAALAVHFANKLGDEGVKLNSGQVEAVKVRFLGVWDIVASFGLSLDTIINFQKINLGWDINTVNGCVEHCSHAMAIDERRESFTVTRLDPNNQHNKIQEVWFRGVHSDIGGGNNNKIRSNIALQWMLHKARNCGLTFNETKTKLPRYSSVSRFSPIYENKDVKIDSRRKVEKNDEIHPTAQPITLDIGQTHYCEVFAKSKYNWSGIRLIKGHIYTFTIATNDTWKDDDINCSPRGWETNELPWYKEGIVNLVEQYRRFPDANWFALIGALDDNDDDLFLIADGLQSYTATRDADLYMFANDLKSKYGNNDGSLNVVITRTA